MRPPKTGRVDVFDVLTPGLALRHSHTGRRTWTLFYRFDGRQHRLTLGRHPEIELKQARQLAYKALEQVERGENPAAIRAEDRRQKDAGLYNYENVAREFIDTYAKPQNRTWLEQEQVLEQNAAPKWTGRDIRTLTKADVKQLYRAAERRTSSARADRILTTVKRFFSWAVDQDYLAQSPAAGVKKKKRMPRKRILGQEEIRAVWNACDTLGDPFGPAAQFLMLTGQRRGEVSQMRWQDVNLNEAAWLIPGEMTKNGEPHHVPLSAPAMEIIGARPQWEGVPFIFTSGRANSQGFLQGWSQFKQRLDEVSGVQDWRIHDLRRTVGSNLGRWVGYEIVGAVLNYSRSGLMGVTATYNLYEYADEKRLALERWAAHLGSIVKPETDNVVSLKGATHGS